MQETFRKETGLIIHPVLRQQKADTGVYRSFEAQIEEAEGLARAINLELFDTYAVPVSKIQAGSYLGQGQRETIATLIADQKPDVVIFNQTLSPVQQRNLEREWHCKVIDRTGLILEIFGERAQTREGRLQVDLAALEYQRSRLVRSWTHLERQRGGAGFMGGPGERQIEIDRRLIDERITKLKKELETVRRTRDLGRQSRDRVPFPTIALVGYTNAGKSTLFNRLTDADVFAKDLLFATLDPTVRRIALPGNQKAILSDTVGFISELTTHLIAAFRATLEQITHADVIAHVIDVSCPDHQAQREDVITVLADLGIVFEEDRRCIEVLNKIDLLDEEDRQDFLRKARFSDRMVCVSALTGEGAEDFLTLAGKMTSHGALQVDISVSNQDGKALSWLYEHADVLTREDKENAVALSVRLSAADLGRFEQQYAYEARVHES